MMFLIQSAYFATFVKAVGFLMRQHVSRPGTAVYEVIPTTVALPPTLSISPPRKVKMYIKLNIKIKNHV